MLGVRFEHMGHIAQFYANQVFSVQFRPFGHFLTDSTGFCVRIKSWVCKFGSFDNFGKIAQILVYELSVGCAK